MSSHNTHQSVNMHQVLRAVGYTACVTEGRREAYKQVVRNPWPPTTRMWTILPVYYTTINYVPQ